VKAGQRMERDHALRGLSGLRGKTLHRLNMTIRPYMLLAALAVMLLGAAPAGAPRVPTSIAAPAITCGAWSTVASPSVPMADNFLNSIAIISARDAWAVGTYNTASNVGQTLIEHWNGSSWHVVNSPNPSSLYNALFGIAAVSASDAWAVGSATGPNGTNEMLIERWNGTRWNVARGPSPGKASNDLKAIAAIPGTSAFAAVGAASNSFTGVTHTLIEYYC
jgi:hypothetical protein